MKLSEDTVESHDLLEMRTRIAMFVLLRQHYSVASVALRVKRREEDIKRWIAAGFPLVDVGKSLKDVDSVLVTSTTTPADEVVRRSN